MKNTKRNLIVITDIHPNDGYYHERNNIIGRRFYVHDCWLCCSEKELGYSKTTGFPVCPIIFNGRIVNDTKQHMTFFAIKYEKVPDHGITDKKLLAFLKKNKALKKFVANCKKQTTFENFDVHMERIHIRNDNDAKQWHLMLSWCFPHNTSNEGAEYWVKLFFKAIKEYKHEKGI